MREMRGLPTIPGWTSYSVKYFDRGFIESLKAQTSFVTKATPQAAKICTGCGARQQLNGICVYCKGAV